MSNISVLAVEDDPIHEDKLRMVMDKLGYELIDVVSDPGQLMTLVSATRPDIMLIDIDLGGEITGIDLVKRLNELHDIPTLYVTSFEDDETFQAAKKTLPAAYITKPYKENEIQRAIELALLGEGKMTKKLLHSSYYTDPGKFLFIKEGNLLNKLTITDIVLIEAYDKYCYVHTSNRRYMLKERLKNVVAQLPAREFCQVHRSYAVNLNAIDSIQLKQNKIYVKDTEIGIGKTYKQDLLARISALG